MPHLIFAIAGMLAALVVGATTDEIIRNVYDSTNMALRVNVAAGTTGAPTSADYLVGTSNATLTNEIVVTPTDDSTIVGNGTTWQVKAVPSCSAASSAVTYNTTTNAWGCNTLGAGTIGGSGTLNTVPKFTPDGLTLGNSQLTDDGTTVSSAGNFSATTKGVAISVTNDTVTGTTSNKLVKLTSIGRGIITATSETAGIMGKIGRAHV